MKLFSLLLMTVFLSRGCGEQPQDLDAAVLDYTANTRGFYQHVIVKNHEISVSKTRGDQDMATKKIGDQDWKALLAEASKIKLEDLPNFKDPTQKRFYDGAAMADLKVTYQEKEYQSTTFDHGTPPVELKALVDKLLEVAQK